MYDADHNTLFRIYKSLICSKVDYGDTVFNFVEFR